MALVTAYDILANGFQFVDMTSVPGYVSRKPLKLDSQVVYLGSGKRSGLVCILGPNRKSTRFSCRMWFRPVMYTVVVFDDRRNYCRQYEYADYTDAYYRFNRARAGNNRVYLYYDGISDYLFAKSYIPYDRTYQHFDSIGVRGPEVCCKWGR